MNLSITEGFKGLSISSSNIKRGRPSLLSAVYIALIKVISICSPDDKYYKYVAKYNEEKEAIEEQLTKGALPVSNLDECIDVAIDFAVNMPKRWVSAGYHIKQRLQFLLFPEEISYNRENDQFRTTRINSVFLYLAYLKQGTLKKERGIPALQLNYSSLSRSVAGAGLYFAF